MARASGVRCDVCLEFTECENGDQRPPKWMRLTVGTSADGIDICSNKCLKKLAGDRVAAEKDLDLAPKQKVSDGEAVAASGRGRKEWMTHLSNHQQKNTVEPGCYYCEKATAGDDEPAEAELTVVAS